MGKKNPPKTRNESVVASFRLEISPMVSCPFREKMSGWSVKSRYLYDTILCFIDIVRINYARSYNIQIFFLPSYRCDF